MIDGNFKLALFAYNFPHKKTQDFLFRLLVEGLTPDIVLAANRTDLKIPQPTLRVKPNHIDLIHPREICNRFGIYYYVLEHNSEECCRLLRENQITIGVISGARILDQKVIESVAKGIINIHPGLLPEGRGLDALQWAIIENRPLGVTAHIINRRVDNGRILKRFEICEYFDDTLIDLSLRLEQAQTTILAEAITTLEINPIECFDLVGDAYPLHRKMPPELENQLPSLFNRRLKDRRTNG